MEQMLMGSCEYGIRIGRHTRARLEILHIILLMCKP